MSERVALGSPAGIGPLLLVTAWYPPTIGGVAQVAERLNKLLSAAGVATSVWLCSDEARSEADGRSRNPIHQRAIPGYVFYELTPKAIAATLLRAPATLYAAFRFVRKHRIRTVVLLYPTSSAWPFVILRRLGLVRLIASCHGNELLTFARSSRLARWLLRRVLRSCDAVTVPAAHLTEEAIAIAARSSLPIWLIPNCVDEQWFVPRPEHVPAGHRPTFIHVSAFTPRKRTLDIVNAFSLACLPPESRLIMVGAGPELEATKKLAENLGLGARVEFAGTPADIRPLLWQSDILVMASDEESGPLTLLEAMACEVPWIMTPWGIAMTLKAGEYGLVVPSRSPASMAAAMEDLVADRERLRAMGRRGREKVLEEFSESTYLARHLALLSAVERGRGRATVDYAAASGSKSEKPAESWDAVIRQAAADMRTDVPEAACSTPERRT